MTCRIVKTGTGGQLAIVCSRGRRVRTCSAPGCKRPATKLCDHPVSVYGQRSAITDGTAKTCDAPICDEHARRVGRDLDHCPKHYGPSPEKPFDWREELGLPILSNMDPDVQLAIATAAHRTLAKKAHPDAGGSEERMARLNKAIEAAREELKG